MKNKKISTTISLTLVFLLVIFTFVPLFSVSVSANPANPSQPPNPSPDKCYYFSDYAPSQSFYNSNISNMFTESSLFYYEGTAFPEAVRSAFLSGELNNISNAYIIFEMRQKLETVCIPEDANAFTPFFPTMLTQIFATLKSNNCKILFISGTNEMRYTAYYAALFAQLDAYVDVDVWDVFVATIFQTACNNSSNSLPLQNTTFILDYSLSCDYNMNGESWFMRNYMIPFIRSLYRSEIESGNTDHIAVSSANNIRVLCYLETGMFYAPLENEEPFYADSEGFVDKYLNGKNVYAIGTGQSGDILLDGWLSAVEGIFADSTANAQIYLFNTQNSNISPTTNVQTAEDTIAVWDVISAFIGNQNMSQYNNHPNIYVPVYYRPYLGAGGWLMNFTIGNSGLPVDWCQGIMTSDEYEYFFEYSD